VQYISFFDLILSCIGIDVRHVWNYEPPIWKEGEVTNMSALLSEANKHVKSDS